MAGEIAKRVVTLIPGDGIGPEVVEATVKVLDQAGAQIEYDRQDAGTGALARHGTPIPDATIEAIGSGVALKDLSRLRSARDSAP